MDNKEKTEESSSPLTEEQKRLIELEKWIDEHSIKPGRFIPPELAQNLDE